MNNQTEPTNKQWIVRGGSIRGASHKRAGVANQDAIRWFPEDGASERAILSVADGHGSEECFRSARGAQIATKISQEIALDLMNTATAWNLSTINEYINRGIPRHIVQKWRSAVQADLHSIPFSEAELTLLADRCSLLDRPAADPDPILAYGTTLLTVMVTPLFVALWQIGDGDIVGVCQQGDPSWLLQDREVLLGNDVRSLSDPYAARYFCTALTGTLPPLIILSTDGLVNSYQDDADFLKFASDLYRIVSTDGIEVIEQNLDRWLDEFSQGGSGDDITVGILSNTHIHRKGSNIASIETPPEESQRHLGV